MEGKTAIILHGITAGLSCFMGVVYLMDHNVGLGTLWMVIGAINICLMGQQARNSKNNRR